MAHFPQVAPKASEACGDAVARLAVIGDQLKKSEASAAGPASDDDQWADRIFDAAAAGLQALAGVDSNGSAEAGHELVERIRRELAEISGVVFR